MVTKSVLNVAKSMLQLRKFRVFDGVCFVVKRERVGGEF